MADAFTFADALLSWWDDHGRKDLPWQQNRTPYRVWVSEIMLQQTQVTTVIPYYQRFMESFPDVHALALAHIDEVLAHWAGLGYYARGRNLHKAARTVVAEYNGNFPADLEVLTALPGIGRSTAGAILALSMGQQATILDGNVKRVLSRFLALEGWPGTTENTRWLWQQAEELTPAHRVADYTQAIMDLGATLCTRSKPGCEQCPMISKCGAFAKGKATAYPVSKPRKAIPEKETWMLILRDDDNRLWLEQRPETGIWGGLWSLPEATGDSAQEALGRFSKRLGGSLQLIQESAPLRHAFSHFRLTIRPLVATPEYADRVGESLEGYGNKWFEEAAISALGLPAPIQKILEAQK